MGLFMFAWLVGEGIIVYRWFKAGAPPTPGALLMPSAIYLALAVLAEHEPARFTATALAWGVDVAVLLQIIGKEPGQVTGWPPPMITDTSVVFPSGTSAAAKPSSSAASSAPAGPAAALPPGATLA